MIDTISIPQPIFPPDPARPMAHCATLTVLSDGRLLSAWYAGSDEGAQDVVILASAFTGSGWSVPSVIARVPGFSLGQPVFLPHANGDVVLFFDVIVDPAAGWSGAQPRWQRSSDGGKTWSIPGRLMDYSGLMFRGHPQRLDNRILLPVYDEIKWQSRMLISDDAGSSWRLTAPIITPPGNIQPCLTPLDDGRLLAYLRTGGKGGWIWRAVSSDGGDTWSAAEPTRLPNPNSGIDLLCTQAGQLLLAYNPRPRRRTPLALAWASQAEDWSIPQAVENGPGEFSYPCLAQTPDGHCHLVYTWHRQTINHLSFSLT